MKFDVGDLVGLGRVERVAVSPDGTWLAVAVAELDEEAARYRSTLYRVPVDGGAPERLLEGRFDDRAPRFRPDGALGFLSDRSPDAFGPEDAAADDARKQVWLYEADGLRPLTDEPLGVLQFNFARGRLVVLAPVLPEVPHTEQRQVADERRKKGPTLLRYQEMPVRHWDRWLPEASPHFIAYDGTGAQRQDLTPDARRELFEAEWDLSDDGTRLVTTWTTTGAHRLQVAALAVFDLLQGTRQLLGHSDTTWHAAPRFSPDGQRVATQRGELSVDAFGRRTLWIYDLTRGQGNAVAEEWDRWPRPVGWADPHTVLVTAEDEGDVPVFRVALGSGAVRRVTPSGTHDSVVVHRDNLFGIRHGTLQPPEVFRAALGSPGEHEGQVRLLTQLSGLSAFGEHVEIEDITVPTRDGRQVACRLARPRGASGPLPTVLWIHGGPVSQWGDGWHWRWNPLVLTSRGYQVALPEPRGSTGRGQDWVEGIWGNCWGERCYEDLMDVTDHLVARKDVDEQRIAAMGGSFGGYMTNWIGTQTDRFRCLVTHASIFSFTTFHGATDLPAWWAHMLGVHPWSDREALDRYSPDRHVESWVTPTLILHGEKDYRVPVSEALHLFEALQLHGVPSELAVFPDENHWILRPRNVVAWYDLVLEWLDQHLAPEG